MGICKICETVSAIYHSFFYELATRTEVVTRSSAPPFSLWYSFPHAPGQILQDCGRPATCKLISSRQDQVRKEINPGAKSSGVKLGMVQRSTIQCHRFDLVNMAHIETRNYFPTAYQLKQDHGMAEINLIDK